jgi:hypothetical protein
MSSGTTKEEDEAIWNDIDQSGVELELRAMRVARQAGWHISANDYYLDLDEQKGRQLDLEAHQEIHLEAGNYMLWVVFNLLIECKKLPGNVWTFFPSDLASHGGLAAYDFLSGRLSDRADGIKTAFGSSLNRILVPDAVCGHYRESILDTRRSNKRMDNIFESTVAVSKAREYFLSDRTKGHRQAAQEYCDELISEGVVHMNGDHLGADRIFDSSSVYHSLVVLDGWLKVATLEPRKLVPARFVRLEVPYKSREYDMRYQSVDICTIDYLSEYLHNFAEAVADFEAFAGRTGRGKGAYYRERYDVNKSYLENRHEDAIDNLRRWCKTRFKEL